MIARINGREKTKQDLSLRLSGEFRLGEALLRLGRLESSKTQASGSPRCGFLRLGEDLHLGDRFSRNR